MNDPDFHIASRHSSGRLHISLSGDFSGRCAWQLYKTIRRQGPGYIRVFVDTAGLDQIIPEGLDLFRANMARERLPQDWLYFKGEKGFKMAPDGSRVIIPKKSCGRKPLSKRGAGPFRRRVSSFRK